MTQCQCMDGPNDIDLCCLYCGGTGEYVSDARLAELADCYDHLVQHRDSTSRRDFKISDAQHLAVIRALQRARAERLPTS